MRSSLRERRTARGERADTSTPRGAVLIAPVPHRNRSGGLELASTLLPQISPKQAKQALTTLQELGLLKRSESGRLSQAEAVVETPDGPLGHQVVQFHRVMMQRASEAIERVPREEREIASLTR